MFKIGDHIVYPMYGAGIITEIVEKDFLGEMRMYYNVSLPYRPIRVPPSRLSMVG